MANKLHQILLFYLLLMTTLAAQTDVLKYEAASYSINHTLSHIAPDYFERIKPTLINPNDYNTKDTTMITFYDAETYEEHTTTLKEYGALYAATPEKIECAKKNVERWNFKEKLGKKVVLISCFDKKNLARLKYYQPTTQRPVSATQHQLAAALSKSDSVFWNVKMLSSENYLFFEDNKENRDCYKYAVVAYIRLSDIVFNKDGTEMVIFMGVHYQMDDKKGSGQTGFGGVAYYKKENERWKYMLSDGFWEE